MTRVDPDDRARTAKVRKQRRFERHRHELANANFASAIYGEILVLSVLAALDEHATTAGRVLETVLTSQLVFWLAHAYSETVDRQLKATAQGNSLGWRGVVDVMEHEWPLVQAAGPSVILMALSLAGAFDVRTALNLSFGIGIVVLFGWGTFAGRRAGRSLAQQFIAGALSAAFGLLIVALKILIH